MLRTPVCDVFGIEVPVVMGPLGGPWPQAMELPAAVCRAGGLGSVATTLRTPEQTRADIARLRELLDGTDRPFAVNMTRRPYDPEVFEAIMADPPPVFSMALGEPGDLVKRVHDAGAVFLQQVTNVAQAERAGEAGADVISAQGHESGGFSGLVSALALVPQVVRAIAPIPVIASGGIADGRGLAAALMLGAQGVNIGTRFLATVECGVPEEWKQAIVAAPSQAAVKLTFADVVLPGPTEGGYEVTPRSLRTDFVAEWNAKPDQAAKDADRLRAEVAEAMRNGTAHRLLPLTGQTCGLIDSIEPAADVVRRIVAEAEQALREGAALAR
jgi:nitronate monooxygenase/enoyl-[acyl-carrier protein] reductase II